MAKIKQLKQHDEIFYPITTGEAVIFKDHTNAEVSDEEMEEIFGWNGNYLHFYPTEETDNYITVKQINEQYDERIYQI